MLAVFSLAASAVPAAPLQLSNNTVRYFFGSK